MYTINFKAQSSHANQSVSVDTLAEAIEQFELYRKGGLIPHSGGYVQIVDEAHDDMPLLAWDEGAGRGYVTGQAVIDYRPEEDLPECEDELCAAHDDSHEELCEACERACLRRCLSKLREVAQKA